jgi:hypothetical protein
MIKYSSCQYCSTAVPHGETMCQSCLKIDGARIIAQGDKLELMHSEEIYGEVVC